MRTQTKFRLLIALLWLGTGGFSGHLAGQQLSIFNNNIANPFSVNPSQAGLGDNQILFQHRSQWVGLQGAPEKTLLTSEWRIGKRKTAVGFSVEREQANVIANTSSYATVAKHFPLSANHQLSFGASAGVRYNSIDFNRVNVQDLNDELVFGSRQNSVNFDGRFGLTYRFKALELQAAGLQLFGNKATYDNSFDQDHLEYRFVRHYVFSAAYQLQAGKQIGVRPMVQFRGVEGFPIQPEAILRLDFKNQIWVAGHYRHQAAAAATVGVTLNDKYVLGYSGELSTNRLAGFNGGTHEIMFGIRLGNIFKTESQQKDLVQLQGDVRSYEERLQYLQEANRKLNAEIEAQREKIAELKNGGQELDYAEVRKLVQSETDRAIKEYEAKNPRTVVVESSETSSTGEQEGKNELPSGIVAADQPFYVVIASTKTEKKAEKAVRQALKQFELESFIIHPPSSPYFFVSTGGYNDRESARLELKRVYNSGTDKKFNGKPWIVEPK